MSRKIDGINGVDVEKELEKWLLIHALGWIVGVSIFAGLVWAFTEWYK